MMARARRMEGRGPGARRMRQGLLLLCASSLAAFLWPLWQGRGLSGLRKPSACIAGAYHVHSERSHDSVVPPEAWARAAAAVGLDFIVLTDHNVAPLPAQMLHGVLVLFEREASTPMGHRVEWPGAAVAAHPTDRHRPWRGPLTGTTGLEIASASASARALAGRAWVGIVPALVLGAVRPAVGMAQLYGRDDRALELWDGPGAAAPTLAVGLCSADAHGWLPLEHELSVWRMVLPKLPVRRPLRIEQAQEVLAALADGSSLCVSGLLPEDADLTVAATADGHEGAVAVRAQLRGIQVPTPGGPALRPRLHLLRDGQEVCVSDAATCLVRPAGPGVYRAELTVEVPGLLRQPRRLPLLYSARLRLPEQAHR